MAKATFAWILAVGLYGVVSTAASLTAAEVTADWTRWRGPQGNGITEESGWDPLALSGKPRIAWEVQLGAGYSSVSVRGDRVYTMGFEKPNDVVYCLNLADGKILWRFSYPTKPFQYPGPRATPVVDGECVYTLGAEGHLHCLDASTGKVRWSRNITRDYHARPPLWGHSATPLIEGDWLVLNAGMHGLVLNKKNGQVKWSSPAGTGGYAAPVIGEHAGKKRLYIFGQKGLHAVDVTNGKPLWFHPWETSYDVLAADPIVSGDAVFITSGYGKGCALLDVSKDQPKVLWQNTAIRSHFSSCVLLDGFIYGVDGNTGSGTLKCLDWTTGAEKWRHNTGFGGLIIANRHIVHLNEKGTLRIAKAQPDRYQELVSAPVHGRTCWTAPVLVRGFVFCRNETSKLVCVDLRRAER